MAEDPYKLIDDTYDKALSQIYNKRQAGEMQRAQNEQALQNTLTETNRGYNIAYKNATNPFGYNAEQRGVMGTGVSDYFKNAALGNMMQGQAKAQQTWQQGMNDLATNFNSFLLDLATQETDALTTKNNAYITQGNADRAYDESVRSNSGSGGGSGDDGLILDGTNTPKKVILPGSPDNTSHDAYYGSAGSGTSGYSKPSNNRYVPSSSSGSKSKGQGGSGYNPNPGNSSKSSVN